MFFCKHYEGRSHLDDQVEFTKEQQGFTKPLQSVKTPLTLEHYAKYVGQNNHNS